MNANRKAAIAAAAVIAAGALGALTQKPAPCFTRTGGVTRATVPACAVVGTCSPPGVVKECPK